MKKPCIGWKGHACPMLVDPPALRCPTHAAKRQAQIDARRGTTSERGYGAAHRRERARWAPKVARGEVDCARCGGPIEPGQAWALDHTDERDGYLGPSHKFCNESAAGRKGQRQ